MEMRKYKIAALIGVIIMGIGSFMACLGNAAFITVTGNILLLISMAIMIYAFSFWQP